MATKPIIQISCSTCSHNKTEFSLGCSIGRGGDEREHGFCPAWNLSSKARDIALIDFAWQNGLDKSRIRSKSRINWFKKEQEDGK